MKTGRQFASVKESIRDQPVKVTHHCFPNRLKFSRTVLATGYTQRHIVSAPCLACWAISHFVVFTQLLNDTCNLLLLMIFLNLVLMNL